MIGFHTDWVSPKRKSTIDRAVAEYNKQSPHITINELFIAGQDDNLSQVVVAAAAGNEGDMTLWEMYAVELFASRGMFMPIDRILAQKKIDVDADWYYLPESSTNVLTGERIGMPYQWNMAWWRYDKDLFDRFGAPYPQEGWSLDDVIELAKQTTAAEEGIYGFPHTDASDWWGKYRYWDATLTNAEHTKSTLDTPETLEMMEWWMDLIFKHKVSPKRPSADERAEVKATSIGTTSGVPWGTYENHKKNTGREIAVAPYPILKKTNRKISHTFDQPHLILNAAARHDVESEVVDFLMFMAGEFVGQILAEELPGGSPSKKSVIHNEKYWLRQPPQFVERTLEGYSMMVPAYPPFPHTLPWIKGHRSMYRQVLTGDMTVREFAQQADAAIDASFAGPPD